LYASSTYEGLYGGVFVSGDGGLQWSLRANEEALHGRNLHSLTASPGSTLVFGASEDAILKSADGGKDLVALPSRGDCCLARSRPPAPKAGPACRASRTCSHPRASRRAIEKDKLVLFAGTDAGLFRSSNSGDNLGTSEGRRLDRNSGARDLCAPDGASRLAARTSSALFISRTRAAPGRRPCCPTMSYYLYDLALPVEREYRNSGCNFARPAAFY
jgi:hypothetical protein